MHPFAVKIRWKKKIELNKGVVKEGYSKWYIISATVTIKDSIQNCCILELL